MDHSHLGEVVGDLVEEGVADDSAREDHPIADGHGRQHREDGYGRRRDEHGCEGEHLQRYRIRKGPQVAYILKDAVT